MYCEDCGFPIDEFNDSQTVCPRCGSRPTDAHLNPADIDCMFADAVAESRVQERATQVLEFHFEQSDTHPLQIDDAEWAEEMLHLAKRNPACTEFELLGAVARTRGPGPVIS